MVSDCGRTERCYIQIRVDDGMRGGESRRVVVVSMVGRRTRCVGTGGFACTQRARRTRGLTDGGSYSKQREAPKPSSRHAILSFHNDRVPSRSVSRRNFNTLVYLTNPPPLPPPPPPSIVAPFSTERIPYPPGLGPFLSSRLRESRTNCPCSVLLLLLFFFFFFFFFSSSVLCPLHRHFGVFLFPLRARSFFGIARYLENSFARPRNRLFIFPCRESTTGLPRAERRDLSPVKRPWPTATLSPAGAALDANRRPGHWFPSRKKRIDHSLSD